MSAALQEAAGLGHNSGIDPHSPEADPDFGEFASRRNELLAGAARFHAAFPEILDDDTQAKAGEFVRQNNALKAKVIDRFTTLKRPVLDRGRELDTKKNNIVAVLDNTIAGVNRKMTARARHQEAERRRIAQEEADRLAAIAREKERLAMVEMKAAAEAAALAEPTVPVAVDDAIVAAEQAEVAQRRADAKPADFTRVRGDFGAVSSLREYWKWEMTDKVALIRAIAGADGQPPRLDLLHVLVIDAPAVNRMVTGREAVRALPGFRIWSEKHVATR